MYPKTQWGQHYISADIRCPKACMQKFGECKPNIVTAGMPELTVRGNIRRIIILYLDKP